MIGSLCILLGSIYLIQSSGTSDMEYLTIGLSDALDTRWPWVLSAIGLAIKIPSVPVHIWLPRAHVEANVTTSILLAAIILKLSTYGTIVQLLYILTSSSAYYQDLWLWLAVVSFVHSSLVTSAQVDTKVLIAYSSVAHMAIVTVGLHSNRIEAIVGAILLAVAHAFSSGALFVLFGQVVYDRLHTRVIYYLRSLGTYMPRFRFLMLVAIVANAGTPGSLNWAAELYVLMGAVHQSMIVAVLMASTVLLTAVYSFWLFTAVSSNPAPSDGTTLALTDCTRSEVSSLGYLLVPSFILGLAPYLVERRILVDALSMLY